MFEIYNDSVLSTFMHEDALRALLKTKCCGSSRAESFVSFALAMVALSFRRSSPRAMRTRSNIKWEAQVNSGNDDEEKKPPCIALASRGKKSKNGLAISAH